jgi:hypothetical protein
MTVPPIIYGRIKMAIETRKCGNVIYYILHVTYYIKVLAHKHTTNANYHKSQITNHI